ncbi:MAG: argininosuccinate lyase [Thermoanaerobaculia bacterium]
MSEEKRSQQMWGGRFASGPADALRRLNDSFRFDWLLLEEDVEGSVGWVSALEEAGIVSTTEGKALIDGLREVGEESRSGRLPFDDYEDVHSYVESRLREKVGPLAAKLHTGRSRNDQVATDLRLWLKKAFGEAIALVSAVIATLSSIGEREAGTPMPGYTHLKQAEPVSFGHWALAYVTMLGRDVDRLRAASERGDECPLGSAAMAGSPLSIDRGRLARRLGFARATPNSLDAVSDRDGAAEYLFCAALLLGHFSRLAEDLIFFSSDEAGYVDLPDAYATGSSRMPQKKNPDVLELVRGHAGRAIGELAGLLAMMKGLPLAYDKDLQLDKEPLFRTREILSAALPALDGLLSGLGLNRTRMKEAASSDLLLATQVMDAMTARGVPFRDAHEIVSRRIGEAVRRGKTLRELGATEEILESDLQALDVHAALAKKDVIGGTAPWRVREAAKKWKSDAK